jgi:predicted metal-binding membrane protein
MERAARLDDAWLVPFAATILIAWGLLAFGGSVPGLPIFCSAEPWPAMPLSASLDLALLSNVIPQALLGWALMVLAMMLPLAISPLWHLRERSFARRRTRSMLLFTAGFIAVWIAAGIVLEASAWLVRSVLPSPSAATGLAVAAALVWQASPAKQWCLNRCHQRPPLSAFGLAADLDAFGYGVKNGAACAGACWALMLPMLLIGQGQLPAMIAVTLFGIAESLESPAPLAWRLRGGAKALRIIAAWWPMLAQALPQRNLSVLTKSRI